MATSLERLEDQISNLTKLLPMMKILWKSI